MTQQDHDNIIKVALQMDIEVMFAKYRKDVEREGVHIIEPTLEDVMNALLTAITHGANLVVIHSKLTWPYRRDLK